MSLIEVYGPPLFWLAVFGAIGAVVYQVFKRQEQRRDRRPPRQPGPSRPHEQQWPAQPPQPTPPTRPEARPRPAPAPAPVDSRRATELAVAVLPAAVPYEHRATLDAIPFLWSGQRWQALSVRNAQEWGWGVFGSSRSGKGNFLQLVALAALGLGPEACHVWVLDPKTGLDYSFCLQLQHARLYADGIAADGGLQEGYEAALREMQRRNGLLHAAGARSLQEYHRQGHPPLPYLVIIADEVGQLDGRQRALLDKLAAMSAASGMLLFVATQYPTTEYLSSQVQINLQNRLVFRLSSPRYSEVALGLARGARGTYEPAAIASAGVAVLRRGGQELVGRVPEVTDQLRAGLIDTLKLQWPRELAAETPADLPGALDAEPAALAESQPAPSADQPLWTEKHVRVAAWLALEPGISNREIARRLNPGSDGGGDAAVKAKKLRQQVEGVLDDAVRAVRAVRSSADEPPPTTDERRTAEEPSEE